MNCFYIISDTKKDYRLESAEEIKRYLEKNKKCAKIVGNASQVPADDKDSFVIVLGGTVLYCRQLSIWQVQESRFSE